MSETYSLLYTYFLAVSRWILPALAIFMIIQWVRCLKMVKSTTSVLATLISLDGMRFPITSYESSIGRHKFSDVVIDLPIISSKHAVLTKADQAWRISDTGSTGGVSVNGIEIDGPCEVEIGDQIAFSGYITKLSYPENKDMFSIKLPESSSARSPSETPTIMMLSLFQIIMCLQLCLKYYDNVPIMLPITFAVLLLGEWIFYFVNMASGNRFLVELPAFFLTTLGLTVCATAAPSTLLKQLLATVAGFIFFLILSKVLKNIKLTMKLRYVVGISALVLLAINLVFAQVIYGAKNWIDLGFITIQPSEFVKVAFVFAGAATLERLLMKRNLLLFFGLSAGCLGALALMQDFGTASIFFVTMLIIIFLRSGSIKTIIAISMGAIGAIIVIIKLMPHVARRFEAWGQVWKYVDTSGYQQTRALVGIGSGGLLGVGGGNGYLYKVSAADTDLVFGLIFEEWGGIIALLTVAIFAILALYAIRLCRGVHSSYYAIAVCAVASMFLFQSALNIFGSTDILPLTGVTLPFVSNGGSSMMASWGLLAFFKVADSQIGGKNSKKEQ